VNEIKQAMQAAAALVGASSGLPGIQVSRKALPIRKHAISAPGLIFTTSLVYDGAGRCIEVVKVLRGKLPDAAWRFYLVAQIEVSKDDQKRGVPLSNPIPAKTIEAAFGKWDAVFKACCDELERKLAEKTDAVDHPKP
jgi:hypothetical protein